MTTVLALPGLALHEIPEDLVPREPRLGGAAVPVPAARLAALTSTGSVLLGRHPADTHLREFRASVLAETRALFHVPATHTLTVLPTLPSRLRHLIAAQPWASGLEVTGSGPVAGAWRSAVRTSEPVTETDGPAAAARRPAVRTSRPAAETGTSPATTARRSSTTAALKTTGPAPLAVVAAEDPRWRERLGAAAPDGTWRTAELTGTAEVLTAGVVGDTDVAFLCPSALLGVGVGLTVAVLSPRAVSASPGLLDGLDAVGTADLVMFAHGVRALAESDPAHLAARREARRALVVSWAADRDWITAPEARPPGDLTVRLPTRLPRHTVAELGRFLEAAHLAYGLTDSADPHALRIGLYDSLDTADLERLLGLLDFLVARLAPALEGR